MKSLISEVKTSLGSRILSLDELKYAQDFDYNKSKYANMSFPELDDIDIFSILEKPPKNSSIETKKELEYISKKTKNRSIQEIKLVYEVDRDALSIFKPLIEELKIEFPYHKLNTIYNNVVLDLTYHLKYFYNRARPFQVASIYNIEINRIETSTHQSPSYPSGHTIYGALISEILSEEYPAKKAIFRKLGEKCGYARVLQGVHYPSDNEASFELMSRIYPKLSEYYEKI